MTADQKPSLGKRIRAAREEAGLSIRELAGMIGVDSGHLSRVEADERRAKADLLQRIADALEIEAEELLAYIGVKPSLPEPRLYFRRAYGMTDEEAQEAVRLIEQNFRNKPHNRARTDQDYQSK